MKPVETGVRRTAGSDTALLRLAAGTNDPIDLVNPYRFPAPLAPLAAARRRHARISLAAILRGYRRLAGRHDVVVVEAAGGLMVPLTETETTIELAQALDLPLILVIGNRLGAINHTLLTVAAAGANGLHVLAGIVNQVGPVQDQAVRTNLRVLKEVAALPRWAALPYVRAGEPIWKAIGKRLERTGLVKDLLERVTGGA
jgi:dethiobiotin synthetase